MIKRMAFMMALVLALSGGRTVAASSEHMPVAVPPSAETMSHEQTTGEKVEKPGLLPEPTADTLWAAVWVLIIFAVMLLILYPTAWKNVLAGLKEIGRAS